MDELPVITPEMLRNAHTVCLTGGEPFLVNPDTLIDFCRNIRTQYPLIEKLYIYTSGTALRYYMDSELDVLFSYVDGINISPKSKYDWTQFVRMSTEIMPRIAKRHDETSNRLYVFKEQKSNFRKFKKDISKDDIALWNVLSRTWDSTFNTPDNEHFVRLPILF